MPSGDVDPTPVTEQQPDVDSQQESSKSALHANIEAKGDKSYYYAHAKRDTGEAPAPPPVHVVLESRVEAAPEPVDQIFGYQFLEENGSELVKVYLPLEGVGAKLSACPGGAAAAVTADFQPRSLRVDVHHYKPGRILRLAIKELAGEVDVAGCYTKALSNKVVVGLKKVGTAKWGKLIK